MPIPALSRLPDPLYSQHDETAHGLSKLCPACSSWLAPKPVESFYTYRLYACAHCGLQFWQPRLMPDAERTARMFASRDAQLHPLEPGHKLFLNDPQAPKKISLLDVGCGTGNFLVAAWNTGYDVTGTELDPQAA